MGHRGDHVRPRGRPRPPRHGCGTGTLALLLAEEGYLVDGVDFSPAMVVRARAKTAGVPGVGIVAGDASRPPLAPGRYDVVLCRHVLWALPDP